MGRNEKYLPTSKVKYEKTDQKECGDLLPNVAATEPHARIQ